MDKITNEIRLLFSTKAQSENGKRITFIDMAKGFAIILVVMGHRGFISPKTNVWISSFHLPLFFIASGILFELKREKESKCNWFIIKKLKGLMIPYLFFSICSMLLDLYFKPTGAENALLDFKLHLLKTITLQGYSVLWFLPVAFISELILFFSYRKLDINVLTPILIILSILMYYAYNGLSVVAAEAVINIFRIIVKSVIAATFMSFGIVFARAFNRNKELSKSQGIICFVTGIALFATNIIATSYIQLKDLNNLSLGYISVYLMLGMIGSFGVLLICKVCINIAPLTYFGRNSLVIFCTHANCYVLYFGTVLYMHFSNRGLLPFVVNEQITANTYSMIFTFLLEIPIIMMFNVFLPVIVGKKPLKSGI